jgi:hypothetical protein
MSQIFSIQTALYLPAPDIEALIQGRIIVAVPKLSIRSGQRFALFPADSSTIPLPIEQYYRSNFLSIAKKAFNQFSSEKVSIKAWAICEICKILDDTTPLDILSQLTIWTPEGLKKILQRQQYIFLNFLRVYQLLLPQDQEISFDFNQKEKIGKFISLPNSFSSSNSMPVLTDNLFTQRQKQLETLQPPEHPELEHLLAELEFFKMNNPAAEQLQRDIQVFLRWNSEKQTQSIDLDLTWIKTIADVGNSSDGYGFEKLVRRSLIKLGFSGSGLNPAGTGGAGGMDFYCEYPYPIVGECKATKSEKVPDGTPAQLLKIGINHLGKDKYEHAIKLIVAAGELNFYALRTATENEMNVITPETLQKLVELQNTYNNSINLLELKKCLEQSPFGLADDKVNIYINKIEQDIKLRSHIIQLVKQYLENTGFERAGIDALHGFIAGASIKIKTQELHEILIELSSPLTGYLGRIKGEDWRRDRFYFLRDLPVS